MGRLVTEIGAPDTIQFAITASSFGKEFELLELSGDGITPVVATGVKSRRKTTRRILSLQAVVGDISSSLRNELVDVEHARNASVRINFTSGSAYVQYPACTLNVGERSSVGDDSIQAIVVDISGDGFALNDLRSYENVANI